MNKLKILLSHNKSLFCGITDYTDKLYAIINKNGDYEISEINFLLLKKIIKFKGKVIINIHYPYQKIYYSFLNILFLTILKLLFFWKLNIILTLHEFKASAFLRKISALVLIFLSKKIIVTNVSEKKSVDDYFKQKIQLELIPIFSTLAETENSNYEYDIKNKYFVVFGLILPGRKFEKVFDDFLNTENDLKLYVVGARHPRYIEYYNILKDKYGNSERIVWCIEKSIEEINFILKNALFSLNYYSDGISEKRTSTLFFFKHKIPIAANTGNATPQHLKDFFIEYNFNLKNIVDLVEKNKNSVMVEKAFDFYIQNFDEGMIAEKYKKMFEEI